MPAKRAIKILNSQIMKFYSSKSTKEQIHKKALLSKWEQDAGDYDSAWYVHNKSAWKHWCVYSFNLL